MTIPSDTIDKYAQADGVALAPEVADEIKFSTCYMCACRCGIRVYLKDGQVKYIDGNPDHPTNKGVLCAKGSAGIMQHLSPARLKKPLKRVGERGEGKFEEIEWDEALNIATNLMREVRAKDPRKLAFFTGRDQSQSLTGWWATQFGTPNFAAHGGFCSVNMAAAGLYTIGGAFWEFGEPDWEHARYFMMFGIAEDHDSNPIKMGLGQLKDRGDAKIVSVNPVRTGYSAIADEWIGLKPGTDGLFIGSIIHCLLQAEQVDWDFICRYTNGGQLVVQDMGASDHGLIARDAAEKPLGFDLDSDQIVCAEDADVRLALVGEYTLPDGRKAVPAFQLFAEHFMHDDWAPEQVADRCAIQAEDIRRIAAEMAEAAFESNVVIDQEWTDWAGRKHSQFVGRPVAFHAMRGISAHTNGFHTCRMLHHLQIMLGAIDSPGSFRYKPPFPRPTPPGPRPYGLEWAPDTPLDGPPIGNPKGPGDLMVDKDGNPVRIDKAYTWENPLSSHGLMHMVLHNAWAQDPYSIDVLFMYMANMAWNSSMNVADSIKYLTDKDPETGDYKIKNFIYSDAYWSETVAYADLILPDTTYLERWDAISLLDRPISSAHGPADAIRQPVVQPDRDVRGFQSVLLDLGARLRLPGMTNPDGSPKFPGGYADYMVNHERSDGIGPLAGWRGEQGNDHGRGKRNPDQLDAYIKNGCFWQGKIPDDGLYMKHSNKGYLDYAHKMGFIPAPNPITLSIYDEVLQKFRLGAEGLRSKQPPADLKERVARYCSPLPIWYEPFEGAMMENSADYPLSAITQRPAHMYHSWGSQNAWLRQLTSQNFLFVHPETALAAGVEDEAWAWLEGYKGRIKVQVKHMWGTNKGTVWTWNAIGKRKGAWGLSKDAPEVKKSFLLNHLISEKLPGSERSNSDPITGQAAWFDLKVKLYPCEAHEAGETEPMFEAQEAAPIGPVVDGRFGVDLKGAATDNIADQPLSYGTSMKNAQENK